MNKYHYYSNRGLLLTILERQDKIMSQIDDIQAKADANNAKLDLIMPVLQAIQADEAGLKKQIADLIAGGQGATPAQLQKLSDTLDAGSGKISTLKTGLDAIDASVTTGGPDVP